MFKPSESIITNISGLEFDLLRIGHNLNFLVPRLLAFPLTPEIFEQGLLAVSVNYSMEVEENIETLNKIGLK